MLLEIWVHNKFEYCHFQWVKLILSKAFYGVALRLYPKSFIICLTDVISVVEKTFCI